MKIALVFDAPRGSKSPLERGVGGAYLTRALEACAQAAHVEPTYGWFYAVAEPQPGGKAPSIKDVRAGRDALFEQLWSFAPDKVISFGASALNAVAGGEKALAISKTRGVMRMAWATDHEVPWVATISHMAVVAHSDLHRDLVADVYKAMTQGAPLPAMDIDLRVPDTYHDLLEDLEDLQGASVVAVDVETTGLSAAYDDLLAVGIGATYDAHSGIAVVVLPDLLKRDDVRDLLYDDVWQLSRRSVGHNFKFDMQFLAPLVGWAPEGAFLGDTLLLAHLLDERPNRPTSRVRGLGLKELVAVRYDHEYGFDFGHTPQTEEELAALYSYLGEDVVYTTRLWHDLKDEADDESPKLMAVHDSLLMPVSRTIARAELGGAPVDSSYVRDTIRAYEARIARRQAALERSIVPLAPTMVVDNILAPQKIADVMYDEWGMTPDVRKHGVLVTGDRSTDKDHIKSAVSKYLGTHLDRQARWLRSLQLLRRDVRQRTTYEKSLLKRVDPDGRVRASFLIHGTSTGRLSSRDPNLQNVPSVDREDSITWRPMRRAFAPSEGRLWVEVDYSQLELRVAAALSKDAALIEVFRSGRDVHLEIATRIFKKPADQVSKGERFLAKAVSFGIIYGRGALALSAGAEMRYAEQKLAMKAWTEDEANIFIKQFLASYPDLTAWMVRLYDEVPRQGYVESPYGRRRRFPLYPRSKGELGSIQRQGVNTPVQSAASDLCLEAMVELTEQLDHQMIDAQVLFTVHDSICLEVAEDDAVLLEFLCRGVMEKDWMGVPLTVDFEAGPTWADVKELA